MMNLLPKDHFMATTPCPNRDQLLDYLLGKLPDDISDQIAAHLDECPACESAAETLDQVSDTMVSELNRPLTPSRFESEPQYQEALQRVLALAGAESGTVGDSVRTLGEVSPDLGQLGEYRLLEKLGEGGMGAVYKAQHTKLDKLVALKVLPKDRMQNPTAVSRFEREMKAVGRLNHPHIVQAHDAREIDGTHFLAMEYVEGLDLAKLISATGPLRIADACELVRQTAVGLQHAHEQGLVHRDIKPSNLMLSVVRGPLSVAPARAQRMTHHGQLTTDHGQQAIVKILDLGLALLGTNEPNRPEMTAAGTAMGTADYVSPEQVTDSHSVDIRSDIYSLGCTLYKLLTGRAPFVGPEFKNDVTKMMAHVDKTPPAISLLRTDLPPGLAQVIERMMAKRPEDRFATPGEVAIALEPFAVGCDLGRLLNEANGMFGPPAVETSRSASTGKLSGSAHTDTASPGALAPALGGESPPSSPLAPVLRGEAPGVKGPASAGRGSSRRRIWIALAAAAAAIPLCFGIWVILRDRDGKEVARIQVPDGLTAELVDDQGRPVTPQSPDGQAPAPAPMKPPAQQPAGEPAAKEARPSPPATVKIEPEPLAVVPNGKLSPMALVESPEPLKDVRSWTVETYAHRGPVYAVAYSPDGRWLASGGSDATIRIWDADGRQLVKALVGHGDTVRSLSWSPDGKYLASASNDDTIGLWDLETGLLLRRLKGHLDDVNTIAWSPDGRTLASGSWDRTIRLWDLTAAGKCRELTGHEDHVTAVAWSPDGATLASASWDKTVRLWDPVQGESRQTYKVDHLPLAALAWSKDGRRLAAGEGRHFQDGSNIYIWEIANMAADARVLASGCRGIPSLTWSADGKNLVIADPAGYGGLNLWDVDAGKVIDFGAKPTGLSVLAVALAPDGQRLATGGEGGSVQFRRLNAVSSWLTRPVSQQIDCLADCRVADDGHVAPAVVEFGCFYVVQSDAQQLTLTADEFANGYGRRNAPDRVDATSRRLGGINPRAPRVTPTAVNIPPELAPPPRPAALNASAMVAQPPAIDGLVAWSVECRAGRSEVMDLRHSPNGQWLAVAGDDGTVRINAADTYKLVRLFVDPEAGVTQVSWSPDSRFLATANRQSTIRILDTVKGVIAAEYRDASSELNYIAWSPAGPLLASAHSDGCVRVWEVGSQKRPLVLSRHLQAVQQVRWSPDGRRLASGGDDGLLVLWDLAARTAQKVLTGQGRLAWPFAWSPDSERIVVADREQLPIRFWIWDVQRGVVIRQFADQGGMVGGNLELEWFPDGQTVSAVYPKENPLYCNVFWNMDTGEPSFELNSVYRAVSVSPDSGTLYLADSSACSSGLNGVTRLNLRTWWQPTQFPNHSGFASCVRFSPDGKTLASGWQLRLWDVGSGGELRRESGALSHQVAFSADGRRLLVTPWGVAGSVFDRETGEWVRLTEYWPRGDWSPDGRHLAISPANFGWVIRDAETLEVNQRLNGLGETIRWSPDSKRLAGLAGFHATLTILDIDGWRVAKQIQVDDVRNNSVKPIAWDYVTGTAVWPIAWSRDGRLLAVLGAENAVLICDVEAGRVTTRLTGHTNQANAFWWGEGDATLLSGSVAETCIWDMRSFKLVKKIAGDGGDFSADGRLIASRDHSLIRLRTVEDERLLRTILTLRDGAYAVISPDGHYRGSAGLDAELVYVGVTESGEYITLSPAEFEKRFGWKNDPSKVPHLPGME